MEQLSLLGGIAVALWFCWYCTRPRYAFTVQVEQGRPALVHGNLKPGFLAEVADICARNPHARGRIYGRRRGKRVRLEFSRELPGELHQPLRNAWESR